MCRFLRTCLSSDIEICGYFEKQLRFRTIYNFFYLAKKKKKIQNVFTKDLGSALIQSIVNAEVTKNKVI